MYTYERSVICPFRILDLRYSFDFYPYVIRIHARTYLVLVLLLHSHAITLTLWISLLRVTKRYERKGEYSSPATWMR